MPNDKTRDRHTTVTVLDPLRPAVVVRRRVYDAAAEGGAPRVYSMASDAPSALGGGNEDDDESGPPSSINVARALASLRVDELQRVEDLMRADDADEAARASKEVAPRAPSPLPPALQLGEKVSLTELARQMGVPAKELAATLVARGFYAVHAKTLLPRETARVVGEMFGWRVEDKTEAPERGSARRENEPRAGAKRTKKR